MKPASVLCVRDSSPPAVPESTREHCVECGHGVWVSPATRLAVHNHRVFFVCLPCAPTLADDGIELQVQPPTPEQLDELRRVNG